MQPNENQLVFIDENNNEVLCDILFTFYSEEFKKDYVLFIPVTESDDEEVEVGAAAYKQTDDNTGELEPITTDEEWAMIEETFEAWSNEQESEDEE